MKITVTQQDIDGGERRSCTTCPVANAIKHQTGAGRVLVTADMADVSLPDPPRAYVESHRRWLERHEYIRRLYSLPTGVRCTISSFDSTGEMEPFEFEMEPIPF